MRYELKLTFEIHDLQRLVHKLFSSNLRFKEIYKERIVNNIYFDTLDYQDLKANIDGHYQRSKFRIRWYGEAHSFYPILEEKIKKGELGFKKSIDFNERFTKEDLLKNYSLIELDDFDQSNALSLRHPSLINSYHRKYYLSANQKIRVTIDQNIHYAHPTQSSRKMIHNHIGILELKFEQEDYPLVQSLIQSLNLRFDKNSKYVEGMRRILE